MRYAVLSAVVVMAALVVNGRAEEPVAGGARVVAGGGGGAMEVNGIAAKVNGSVVTKNAVAFQLAPLRAQLAAQYPRRGPEYEKQLLVARDKILEELIDREIILHQAKEMGAKIPGRIIDEEIKRQVRELYNGSEERFREELSKARLTMEGYRKMTEEKLIVQAMRAQHFSDAAPPMPDEVAREYAEVKVQMRDTAQDKITFRKIFLPKVVESDPKVTPESQLALAEGLVKQLEGGADFGELAKQHSGDAYAAAGGEWPETNRVDLSPEFAAIVFEAPENKVLGPLEDPNGYTIVVVKSKQLGPPPPLSKVRSVIEERVRRKKTAERYDRWIAGLRKRAMIQRRL